MKIKKVLILIILGILFSCKKETGLGMYSKETIEKAKDLKLDKELTAYIENTYDIIEEDIDRLKDIKPTKLDDIMGELSIGEMLYFSELEDMDTYNIYGYALENNIVDDKEQDILAVYPVYDYRQGKFVFHYSIQEEIPYAPLDNFISFNSREEDYYEYVDEYRGYLQNIKDKKYILYAKLKVFSEAETHYGAEVEFLPPFYMYDLQLINIETRELISESLLIIDGTEKMFYGDVTKSELFDNTNTNVKEVFNKLLSSDS